MTPGENQTAADRILFVDDDLRVLDGYKRMLHAEFSVETASSSAEGLSSIHLFGPFAVVISDMRMPGLDGAEFLAKVRELAPHTVRIVLTGHGDLKRAIAAVNEGQIFRYLTKPCGRDEMVNSIRLGLVQYHKNVEVSQVIKQANHYRLRVASGSSR